jgi:predicted DNA-binding protein (UPF0251 family)/predicted Fe-Mo cluster-binding NifX family protein
MPRPVTGRQVGCPLAPLVFKPAGAPARDLEEVTLGLDGAEAIRLADLEGLYQDAAALRMGVSRQTFGRIVEAARRTVADAIINGKRLRIEGGEIIVRTEGTTTMKIAVPVRGKEVDSHFGHCEGFSVFTLDERKAIVAEELLASPAGCGCKSGVGATLAKMGVSHLVAGNMGEGAVRVLASHGIAVTRGAAGDARAAVERFAAGTLADSGTDCAEHRHAHGQGHDCGHGEG